MQNKAAFAAGGWASPHESHWGKMKVMSELGWPCWAWGLAGMGKKGENRAWGKLR